MRFKDALSIICFSFLASDPSLLFSFLGREKRISTQLTFHNSKAWNLKAWNPEKNYLAVGTFLVINSISNFCPYLHPASQATLLKYTSTPSLYDPVGQNTSTQHFKTLQLLPPQLHWGDKSALNFISRFCFLNILWRQSFHQVTLISSPFHHWKSYLYIRVNIEDWGWMSRAGLWFYVSKLFAMIYWGECNIEKSDSNTVLSISLAPSITLNKHKNI